jgi:hypothetical protein
MSADPEEGKEEKETGFKASSKRGHPELSKPNEWMQLTEPAF